MNITTQCGVNIWFRFWRSLTIAAATPPHPKKFNKLNLAALIVLGSIVVGSTVVGSAVAGSAVVGSAADSSPGAGTDGATSSASRLLFSGLPSEVSSSPAVVVTKKFRILLVPATALSNRRFFSRFFAAPEACAFSTSGLNQRIYSNYIFFVSILLITGSITAHASVLGPRHRRI